MDMKTSSVTLRRDTTHGQRYLWTAPTGETFTIARLDMSRTTWSATGDRGTTLDGLYLSSLRTNLALLVVAS